jgi:signal transduction histidine kinase
MSKFKEKVVLTSSFIIKDGVINYDLVSIINKNLLNSILKEKILILDEKGAIKYNSFDSIDPPFENKFINEIIDNKEAFTSTNAVLSYGILLSGNKNRLVFIAESKKEYLTELNQLKLILLTGWLMSLVIIFITGRYFAGKALQPISKVVKEVDTISSSNLHNRVSEGNGEDEIAHLAITFNRLLARLEIAFQLQRNFVSNASHELRTPLSTITAQLEVTLLNKRTTTEYELVLNSILDDIRDLNHLSEGLFDLTLANRDVSLMKFANVRMDELLLQARKELLKRKNDYKINIHFGEFPDEETALTLFGKEHLLKSVLINLMDNACKFSGNKTADVSLDIELNTIKLTVSDNGIGIPDEYLNNIFKPLLRAENAKRIPGHGLGLALAKKIVELHRGDIQISTAVNKGTTISLKFPSL